MQYDKDMQSIHKELFVSVRKLLLSIDGVKEEKKEKITTYSYNGSGLCHMRTMPHGIDIGFLKGFQMNDKYGLLQGKTKRMKVLPLERLLLKEVKYYIDEAVDKNS